MKQSFIAILDGNNCSSKEKTILEIAKCLKFPSQFGENLDGLEDFINDLSWLDKQQIVLIIKNSSRFLCDEEDELKKVFFSIFQDACYDNYEGESDIDRKELFVFYSDQL